MTTALHIDASQGVAGDMLLAALLDAGADIDAVTSAITAVLPDATIEVSEVRRCGLRATAVTLPDEGSSPIHRWSDLRQVLMDAPLLPAVQQGTIDVFTRLAEAEGSVHGVPADDVHFHEVGAWDSVCDIVGVIAAVVDSGASQISCSPIGTGSGTATTEHGVMPVPTPAVAELLARAEAPTHPGPAAFEACTPTGAALVTHLAAAWTPGPEMTVRAVGVGAGSADPSGHPNVTRVFLGAASTPASRAVVLSTNVDDLDPRLWPGVIGALIEAGASDAWLTPIHMKKGRPALTLDVLCPAGRQEEFAGHIMSLTSAIGMRVIPVGKIAAERSMDTVSVLGHEIGVKVARWQGRVVNVQPEWEHVAAAAAAVGMPPKQMLALALTAAGDRWLNVSIR